MLRLLFLPVLCALICISAGQLEVSAAAKPVLLYVHDNDSPDNRVFAFQWKNNGTLEPLAGSPFSTGASGSGCQGNCETIAYSARKKLLAVSASGGITVYRVAADGALSVVSGSPFAASGTGVAFVEKGTHTYLYTTDFSNNQVVGFEAATDGTLTPLGSPATAGTFPVGISAAKDLVFVANEFASISAFKVATDGGLTEAPGSPFTPGASFILSVQADPGGKLVYAADGGNSALYAFKAHKADAALTALAGSPFVDPIGDTLAVSKKWVVSVPLAGQSVQAFRRNGAGKLTAVGDPQDTGTAKVVGGVFDPTGHFLALMDDFNDQVRTYSVNQQTGHIALVDTEAVDLGQLDGTGMTVARL